MATKSANVTARVQPEIKQQAEAILEQLGLPVSVLIDTLYRQIIMTGVLACRSEAPYTRRHDRRSIQCNDGERLSTGEKRTNRFRR